MNNKSTVVCKLPPVGLGNSLFVWAKAAVFAGLHDLPLHTFGWHNIRLGPWLRRERVKRYYGAYFRPDGSTARSLLRFARYRAGARIESAVSNPPLTASQTELGAPRWIVFNEVPPWRDYFQELQPHREFVRRELKRRVRQEILDKVDAVPAPGIGVHVRMGDFRPLLSGEDFSKLGVVRTPQQYFVSMIERLRAAANQSVPVTIFSDGYAHELRALLDLPNTQLAAPQEDIADMLLLARSKVIVTSAGSTFGYWAGFLSDAAIVMHPDHIHGSIRGDTSGLPEGPLTSELCEDVRRSFGQT